MSIRHTRYVHDYYTARTDYVPKPIHIIPASFPKFFSVPLVHNFGTPPSLSSTLIRNNWNPLTFPNYLPRILRAEY